MVVFREFFIEFSICVCKCSSQFAWPLSFSNFTSNFTSFELHDLNPPCRSSFVLEVGANRCSAFTTRRLTSIVSSEFSGSYSCFLGSGLSVIATVMSLQLALLQLCRYSYVATFSCWKSTGLTPTNRGFFRLLGPNLTVAPPEIDRSASNKSWPFCGWSGPKVLLLFATVMSLQLVLLRLFRQSDDVTFSC